MFGFKTLRDELREAHRREQRLLGIIGDLNDRLASAHDKPWTLPPRPLAPPRDLTPEEHALREYEDGFSEEA